MGISITPGRYEHLKTAYEGFKRTGLSFVEYDNNQFLPCLTNDDIGYYCIIPRIMHYLHIDLDTALYVFVFSATALSVISALIAFFKLYSSWAARAIAITGLLLLSAITYKHVDVYKMYIIINVALIPWALYFAQPHPHVRSFLFFSFCAGFFIGTAHYIRGYSGLAALTFLLIIISTHITLHTKQKLLLLCSLLAGLLIPFALVSYEYYNYRKFAAVHLSQHRSASTHHNIWHPIYCGLGFVANKYTIYFNDEAGTNKAREINPQINFYDDEHDFILKNAVMHLVTTDPWFIILNIWAKIGVALLYILVFANVGLIAAFYYPKGWRIELAFIAALAASALKNIIVTPGIYYSLSTMSCATIYGITSLCYAFNSLTYQRYKKKEKLLCR